jgi:SAM-dependent methyltransferase
MQKTLSTKQIEAFHHTDFVEDQVKHFIMLFSERPLLDNVLDVGGGCGHFASKLNATNLYKAKVIDMDPASIDACRAVGVDASIGDALAPTIAGDEDIVCFNLILHHLVSGSDMESLKLQKQALMAWHKSAKALFVNEYIYDSYIKFFSGWLIFQITRSTALSAIGRFVAKFIPSLNANTFGVGVRFRSHVEWCAIFEAAGFTIDSVISGDNEFVSLARRLLFIKNIRRVSYVLTPNKL